MAEISISQQDIDSIARKLDDFGDVLSENERGVLLAIFGLAATAIGSASSESEAAGNPITHSIASFSDTRLSFSGRLPRLSDGFQNAFRPGAAGRFKIGSIGTVADVAVGGTTVTWSA